MSVQAVRNTYENDNQKPEKLGSKARFSPKRLVPVAVIVAGFAAFFAFDLDQYLSFEAFADHRKDLMAWTDANSLLAAVVFMGLYALAVAFSIPGAVWLTIIGGFLFGTFGATAYVVVGATMGATAVFLIARYAAGDYLCAKAGGRIKKMEDGFNDNAFSYMIFLRLVPVFPFWLVNLAPAMVGCPLRTYVVATFFGIIPGTFVYALVGNGLGAVFDAGGKPDVGIIFSPEILGPMVGLSLLALVPVVYKKYKAAKQQA